MQTEKAIVSRRSTRYFTDEQLPEEVITALIKDAQRAPSWANSQPWHVYVATGQTLSKLEAHHIQLSKQNVQGKSELETISRTEWRDDAQKNMAHWNQSIKTLFENDMTEFLNSQKTLYNAPAIFYLTIGKTAGQANDWSLFDLGAFAQTLMLAATDHGLQSLPAYELVKYPEQVRKTMGIKDDEILIMGVAIGHPDTSKKMNELYTDRLDIDQVLTLKK